LRRIGDLDDAVQYRSQEIKKDAAMY